MSNIYKNYNPDILETIANLSNDEVFTPPELANKILDMLPEEVWNNPNLTFLDPAVKTGIFLREIASRLIDGLAEEIPDLQERVNHILTKQVFGIGITELTTLMARRTVYCSTTANGKFSICTEFDDGKGNIIFPDTEHTWDKNGRCEYCGANEGEYNRGANFESHAYPFIHDNFKKEFGNMKFDVIIGNPPYQLNVGNEGANSSKSKAIYNLFIDKSIELKPKYITMIIPSRWMTSASEGIPKTWVNKMVMDYRFKIIKDFENADNIFKNVGIMGGVNYFLWDSEYNGKCHYEFTDSNEVTSSKKMFLNEIDDDLIIRDLKIHPILNKVKKKHSEYYKEEKDNFSGYVAPFDLGDRLATNWRGYSKEEDSENNIKYYVSESTNGVPYGWIKKEDISRHHKVVNMHKIFLPRAHGGLKQMLGLPRYGEPNSAASHTYVIIGYKQNLTEQECLNVMTYIHTKFFRFMVGIRKKTQMATRKAYQFVPLQDFSKPWTDEELYKKYKLTQEEIDYIEETIAPMPASDD